MGMTDSPRMMALHKFKYIADTNKQCCGSGSGPFSRIRIRSNFPDPDPTIKSHITRSKSNKLNRYFCEQFTFFKIKPANSEKGGRGQGGRGRG